MRASTRPLSALGFALGLACGGGSADIMNSTSGTPVEVPSWTCVPGEDRPCDCPDELDGVQVCNADGSAFGECDCSPGALSQGPPPTSTGSGTGTGSGTADDTASDTGPGTTVDPTTVGPGSTTDPETTTGDASTSTGAGSSSSSGGSSSSG